jgi:bidirectional [NiFe] hydrogenase diaphorase subunit
MIKLTIDDRVIEAEEGSTILQAAEQAGINIPTVCYHESLSAAGSCRICAVEVFKDGQPFLTTSCTYPVEEGLKVRTKSPRALEARKLAVELLLALRPHSTKISEIASQLGIEKPRVTLEENECILCGLCVRACSEMVGPDAVIFKTRSKDDTASAEVVHLPEKCIGCDSCAFICPTRAITVEDKGDTRILTTPSCKLEFKLKKCRVCNRYWAPEKQIEYIAKLSGTLPEDYDVCPNCR